MPNDPEKELEEFLASEPEWVQSALKKIPSKTWDETWKRWDERDRLSELRKQYEQLVCQVPGEWEKYRKRYKEELDFSTNFPPPKAKSGRKKNVEQAERIQTLHEAGKTSSEIQKILEAEGLNYSVNGVESYLKTRRRT